GPGIRQRWRLHLDVVEAHDRVDRVARDLRALADDLAMHLALGRDVHDQVAPDGGGTAQTPAFAQWTPPPVLQFQLSGRAHRRRVGGDRWGGSLADLAPPADPPAPAH